VFRHPGGTPSIRRIKAEPACEFAVLCSKRIWPIFEIHALHKSTIFDIIQEQIRICDRAQKTAHDNLRWGRALFPNERETTPISTNASHEEYKDAVVSENNIYFRLTCCIDYTFAMPSAKHGQTVLLTRYLGSVTMGPVGLVFIPVKAPTDSPWISTSFTGFILNKYNAPKAIIINRARTARTYSTHQPPSLCDLCRSVAIPGMVAFAP